MIGIFFNALVIIVFLRNHSIRRQITYVFIANLAAIDGTLSLIVMLTAIVNPRSATVYLNNSNYHDEVVCKIWYSHSILWGLVMSSAYGIVLLAFDSYLNAVHRAWYLISFTRVKVSWWCFA